MQFIKEIYNLEIPKINKVIDNLVATILIDRTIYDIFQNKKLGLNYLILTFIVENF